jgi:hypothetical protein
MKIFMKQLVLSVLSKVIVTLVSAYIYGTTKKRTRQEEAKKVDYTKPDDTTYRSYRQAKARHDSMEALRYWMVNNETLQDMTELEKAKHKKAGRIVFAGLLAT